MLSESDRAAVGAVLSECQHLPGPLLPVLHGIQEALGHVPADCVEQIALALGLSRAEVHGVITYYHDFRAQPAGRHVVKVCRAESCQAMGADALWAHACLHLGRDGAGTTADGAVTLEPVYCLGMCALSPAISIDDRPHARMDPSRFDRLLGQARASR